MLSAARSLCREPQSWFVKCCVNTPKYLEVRCPAQREKPNIYLQRGFQCCCNTSCLFWICTWFLNEKTQIFVHLWNVFDSTREKRSLILFLFSMDSKDHYTALSRKRKTRAEQYLSVNLFQRFLVYFHLF